MCDNENLYTLCHSRGLFKVLGGTEISSIVLWVDIQVYFYNTENEQIQAHM